MNQAWLLQLAVVGGGTGGWMFFVLIQLWLTDACSQKKKNPKPHHEGFALLMQNKMQH